MKVFLAIVTGSAFLVLLLLLGPLILLSSLNTISEQSSMGWYIPHNVWTYLSCYGVFLLSQRGRP